MRMSGGASDPRKRDYRDERAEKRRDALRRLLDERGLTLKQAAQNAGLSSASPLGNFLNGLASSLSMETAEPLAASLGISLNELVGDDQWVVVRSRPIQLRGDIATGEWQEKYCWEAERWKNMIIPVHYEVFEGSYYLRLATAEMNEVYPINTILEVIDLAKYPRPLTSGKRVIVNRQKARRRKIEVGCREIVASVDGTPVCHLAARSVDPLFRGTVDRVPWPIDNPTHTLPNGDRITIVAVVVSSIRRED